MGDALKDLRTWQREHASQQEKALRAARRALQMVEDLDAKWFGAVDALTTALTDLEATGLSREQCAAFLDVELVELGRITARKPSSRANRSGRDDQKAR